MNTRRFFLATALFALLGPGLAACATANGQTAPAADSAVQSAQSADTTKAALGVRKPKHVSVAIMTARDMLSGEAEQPADEVAIVTCGPAIRALAQDSDRASEVRQALDRGIAIKACGVTVERMGFDADRFIDGVEVVPNGFVELIRLQKQGYLSIEL
jgi:hypothetical protein